jgi:hypothetical protein
VDVAGPGRIKEAVVVEGTLVVGGGVATLALRKGLIKFKSSMPLLRLWMCLYW